MATLTLVPGSPQHPRLALVTVAGIGLLAIAGIIALAPVGNSLITVRVGVIGYLLVLAGGAGYLALSIHTYIETR